MPHELTRLGAELVRVYEAFPNREQAVFNPAEPNLKLAFTVGTRGQVEGKYELCADLVTGPSMPSTT